MLPVFLVRHRRAERRRSHVADAFAARAADVVIVLIEIPEPQRPVADPDRVRNQRPVFVLQLRPQLGGHARRLIGLASHA